MKQNLAQNNSDFVPFSGKGKLAVALVQLASGTDPKRNLEIAHNLVTKAADEGARLIQLPEIANLAQRDFETARPLLQNQDDDAFLKAMQAVAKDKSIWLHIGSLALKNPRHAPDMPNVPPAVNRGFLIDPKGQIHAHYDKIHMFNVNLPQGESYHEGANYQAGDKAVMAETDFGGYGLSICYDLRFGYLYRALAQKGAGILGVPAAFTHVTGKAHWHSLLKARAIETASFVLAAAQAGKLEDGRHCYGHSLIIDPWGQVVGELTDDKPSILSAVLDLDKVASCRAMIPAISADAIFS